MPRRASAPAPERSPSARTTTPSPPRSAPTPSGTYEYDAQTHVVTLHFAKGKLNLGSVPGHAYISGQELVLVFPVTRLVEVVTALGSKVSYFSTATTLLSKYKNVYVGFAFSK